MALDCCNLVGNFDINLEGVISISSKGSTPVQLYTNGNTNTITVAPSTGTVSITVYAGTQVHNGCAGKANVTINWVTRTICDDEFKNVYMFGGAGQSYIQGDVGNLAEFPTVIGVTNPVNDYEIVDASASSGPASLYVKDMQYDGFGLIYNGNPWIINTMNKEECVKNLSTHGIGDYGECMLQSISLTCTPGQIPTASFDFIYSLS